MNRDHLASLAIAAVLACLGVVLFAPTLVWLARTWHVHPYYGHGWLVPIVAGAFAWRARDRFTGGASSNAGVVVIAAGLGLHLAAVRWQAFPASALALVVVLVGIALAAGGWPAGRAALFPAALLALAIPWPFVERTAPFLAASVARAAALSAGAVGVGVVQQGAELSVRGGAFTVGAPCSGLGSAIALVTLAVILAGVLDGAWQRRAALVVFALPLALTANWLRLTGLLWLVDVVGPTQGLAWFHGPLGPLAYLGAAVGLIGAGRWLGCDVRAAA